MYQLNVRSVYWLPIGPVVEELLWPPRRNITNSKISDFNQQVGLLNTQLYCTTVLSYMHTIP
jgi:hypothetical protein